MKLEPRMILKFVLNFNEFEPWYSYKLYSYKRECLTLKFNTFIGMAKLNETLGIIPDVNLY